MGIDKQISYKITKRAEAALLVLKAEALSRQVSLLLSEKPELCAEKPALAFAHEALINEIITFSQNLSEDNDDDRQPDETLPGVEEVDDWP